MRRDILVQILQITMMQEQELKNNNYERFIELLDDRQRLMDKIEVGIQKIPLREEERVAILQIKEIDDRNIIEYNGQLEATKAELRKINYLRLKNIHYINPYDMLGKGLYVDKR